MMHCMEDGPDEGRENSGPEGGGVDEASLNPIKNPLIGEGVQTEGGADSLIGSTWLSGDRRKDICGIRDERLEI